MALVKRNKKNPMEIYTAQAGKAALDLVVPYAIETGKQLAVAAGKKLANRAKALAAPKRAMDTGALPHVPGVPVSIGTRFSQFKPKFQTKGQSVTITHVEAVENVNMFNGTSVSTIGLVNPFNPYVFPWLSTIAGSYDRYKINKCVVEFVPACATAQTGQVVIAWDPQATDAMVDYFDMSLMHSTTFSPWMPATLALPPSAIKYMGEQVTMSGSSMDLYNHGNLYVGVMGSDANLAGTLYVSYSIQLFDPQPTTGLAAVANVNAPGSGTLFPGGNVIAVDGFNLLSAGSNGILVPMGTWKFEIVYTGTVLGAAVTVTVGGGCTKTTTVTTTNSGATQNQTYTFLKSNGSLAAYVSSSITYTTITGLQMRLSRVDPYSFISSNVTV